jgi:hypothetical protein
MSGRRSRTKGAAFERLTARTLKPHWPEARRGIGQARSAGEVADVQGTPFWVECKRQKRCNIQAAYKQAQEATDGRPPLVVTRDDNSTTLVTMDMETFLKWLTANPYPTSTT